jgi:lysosomal acid lipase/cholesteryl ester hydrolase
MWRIRKGAAPYGAVLLLHDIKGDGTNWIINEVTKAPAFRLANEGYEVWIGNSRGSYYSQTHTSLSPNMTMYWEFTIEDSATKDIAAFIDKALGVSDFNIFEAVIGHGMGNTQYFVAASLNPDYYEQKVKVAIALAPALRPDLAN